MADPRDIFFGGGSGTATEQNSEVVPEIITTAKRAPAPSAMNKFLTSFETDLARPNRFDCSMVVPAGVDRLGGIRSDNRYLALRCEAAELPGRALVTHDQKIYGPIEKFPYQQSYTDITLTYIVDETMSVKLLFDGWLDLISPAYGTGNYNFEYKDNYKTDITINQYDVRGILIYSVKLIDAFPIAVNQLDLDWSSDGHHKLAVVFAYTYYDPYSAEIPKSGYSGKLLK